MLRYLLVCVAEGHCYAIQQCLDTDDVSCMHAVASYTFQQGFAACCGDTYDSFSLSSTVTSTHMALTPTVGSASRSCVSVRQQISPDCLAGIHVCHVIVAHIMEDLHSACAYHCGSVCSTQGCVISNHFEVGASHIGCTLCNLHSGQLCT
jgi:hypothetical protein